ncbi:uncharacterized protein RCH25_018364 [Pelodytes ibericus]
MAYSLLFRVALLCLSFPCLVDTASFPNGVYKTQCRDRFFWIWVERDFLGPEWQLEAFNETGYPIVLDSDLSAQCGYTKTRDIYGNVEIRISFLACWITNVNDLSFQSVVQFRVNQGTGGVGYMVSMSCQLLDPWNMREIICEENYMEVSVIRIVPLDSSWLKTDPQRSWPVMQGLSQRWQVEFTVNQSMTRVPAIDAYRKGYGLNATATRVVFRAPYHTLESMILADGGFHYDLVLSMMYYTQTLVRLIVNTSIACPNDPPVFTPTSLSWLSPAVLSPLVFDPSAFSNVGLNLGLNGVLIQSNQIAQNGYIFSKDSTTVEVTVPIGAPGGHTESDILNNTYVTSYRIHLLLEHEWSEFSPDLTRHIIFKPIITPLRPELLIFINNTDPEKLYFDVSLGNFFPDVDLKSFVIKKVPLTLPDARRRGFNVIKVPNANGTNAFVLQVPFTDPLVEQKYLNGTRRSYILYVTYVMTLLNKPKDLTYTDVVECIRRDVVPPTYSGSCGSDRLILDMTHGNMDQYWIPYIRNLPLTSELARSQNYVVSQRGSTFHIEVPLFAVGLVYEDITLRGIVANLDFTLRDNKTLAVMSSFSVVCKFPTDRLLVCLPNGTVKATVLSLDTKPMFDPRKTHLKDPTCAPQEADEARALFSYTVHECGTTRRFDGDFLVYENEVSYDREFLLPDRPIISRDSTYRLTLRCRYPVRDIQRLFGNSKTSPIQRGISTVYRSSQAKVLRKREKDSRAAMLRVAKDDSFTSFYQSGDFPVSIWGAACLYFEADLHRRPSGLPPTMLKECWATPSPQMDSSPQWDLIMNGCAKDGTSYLMDGQMARDSPQRFSVTINRNFSHQIYVHCLASSHNYEVSCTETSGLEKGKRSVPQADSYEVISVGPVEVLADDGVEYQHVGEKSWSVWTWFLSVGLAVLAVFTIAAVSLAVRLLLPVLTAWSMDVEGILTALRAEALVDSGRQLQMQFSRLQAAPAVDQAGAPLQAARAGLLRPRW